MAALTLVAPIPHAREAEPSAALRQQSDPLGPPGRRYGGRPPAQLRFSGIGWGRTLELGRLEHRSCGCRGAGGAGAVGGAGELSAFQIRGHRQRAASKDQQCSARVPLFIR